MVRIRSVFATGLALLQLCAFVEAATWSVVTFNGTEPWARYDHTAVWSEAADGMYIFGGREQSWTGRYNDLHFFDRQAAMWSEVAFSGTVPTARSKHTAVWSEAANGMYIFGGTSKDYTTEGLFNDLHFFDRQAATWSKVTFSGTAPTARSGHSAVWSEAADGMYIFGGVGSSLSRFNDLHFFDRQAATWSEVNFSGIPPFERYAHTAVWSKAADGMYIFGGVGSSRFDNLHFFDPQAAAWSRVTFSGDEGMRSKHTAVWSEAANGMYIFGGYDGTARWKNLLYFFDPQGTTTSTMTITTTSNTTTDIGTSTSVASSLSVTNSTSAAHQAKMYFIVSWCAWRVVLAGLIVHENHFC